MIIFMVPTKKIYHARRFFYLISILSDNLLFVNIFLNNKDGQIFIKKIYEVLPISLSKKFVRFGGANAENPLGLYLVTHAPVRYIPSKCFNIH